MARMEEHTPSNRIRRMDSHSHFQFHSLPIAAIGGRVAGAKRIFERALEPSGNSTTGAPRLGPIRSNLRLRIERKHQVIRIRRVLPFIHPGGDLHDLLHVM